MNTVGRLRAQIDAAWRLLERTYVEWGEDDAAELAAALAYYTIFSLAPLLIIAIAVAGALLGREAVQGEIVRQIATLVGPDGAHAIQDLIVNASKPSDSLMASIVGFLALLFGASGVVGQLKAALNRIWDVPAKSAGFLGVVRERLASFAVVLGVGFVLLVSLVINAALTAMGTYLRGSVPGDATIWISVNLIVTFAVEAGLFALMFKLLPDVDVQWADVWLGGAVTALLFELGKLLVGIYLGRAGIGSAYGAAGSLIVVLVWVYYSAQILFFGAEFTQVYARRQRGETVRPGMPAGNRTVDDCVAAPPGDIRARST
jgi:membrane protein